jgi:hypothetical protein
MTNKLEVIQAKLDNAVTLLCKRMLKEGIAEVMRAQHDLNDLAGLIVTEEDVVILENAARHNG